MSSNVILIHLCFFFLTLSLKNRYMNTTIRLVLVQLAFCYCCNFWSFSANVSMFSCVLCYCKYACLLTDTQSIVLLIAVSCWFALFFQMKGTQEQLEARGAFACFNRRVLLKTKSFRIFFSFVYKGELIVWCFFLF